MKAFVCGALAAVALASAAAAAAIFLGLAPVAADDQPGALETRLFRLALRKAVARLAGDSRPPPTAEGDTTGEEIYRETCARCHGDPGGKASPLASSFHPPAPILPAHATEWTEPELVWIIRHGIRNTGMPAWGQSLSDDDIGRVAGFVKQFGRPPSPGKSPQRGRS